ncbi:hypothetical protein EUGRSUZ_I00845 [Eucalyptus grandis]|uniref:Uncharacterized protein n=2 Tax=Eucalyptus grandis TaxID=71139 RepID=A0ACC3JDH3_EUCGR|nr:hypothetical protein EUGRSUZ_I00845 [Eucalyptus grandis]
MSHWMEQTIWVQFFPNEFLMPARIWSQDIVDPLCMILYTCQDGNPVRVAELCGNPGLSLASEIAPTASIVGFREEWFKLLLSIICLEEAHLPTLFAELAVVPAYDSKDVQLGYDEFSPDQAFLISTCGRINIITISNEFTLYILGLFRKASGLFDFSVEGNLSLPIGSSRINVLEPMRNTQDTRGALLSSGLLDLLLYLLHELEPPPIIRKAINQGQHQGSADSKQLKQYPYEGFRRDIIVDGITLLMQQCITDEDNPFLREWGIWTIRNLFEGKTKNQQAVTELELRGTVNTPKIAKLGLRMELDQKSGRPKLVNFA